MSVVVSIDALALTPVLAPALGAAAVLVADLVLPRAARTHLGIALLALAIGAASALGRLYGSGLVAGSTLCAPAEPSRCSYVAGNVATMLQLVALLAAGVSVLLSWPAARSEPAGRSAVTTSLLLGATAGATAVAAAQDIGSWLVAIELATLPTVALVALRATRAAVDGAMSLLTTSLVSFAMLALGSACWYAATGSAYFAAAVAGNADHAHRSLLALAVVLIVAGIGFKLSLVPFHAWTPQAYIGGTLPIATFLAATSKAAALAALLVVVRAVAPLGTASLAVIAVLSAVSMTVGNVVALRQDDVVRLLAFSTVAQAGWVVLPLAVLAGDSDSAAGGYLNAYLIATVLVFAVVTILVRRYGDTMRELASYHGLFARHRLLAVALALGLLSLAGLPPGVVGLVAKVAALRPVAAHGLWWLAVVAAANAVLGVAVYLRWLRVMIAPDRAPDRAPTTQGASTGPRRRHPAHIVAFALALVALLATSIDPQLIFGRA